MIKKAISPSMERLYRGLMDLRLIAEMSHGYKVERVTNFPSNMTDNSARQAVSVGASDITHKIGRRNASKQKKADGGKPSGSQ